MIVPGGGFSLDRKSWVECRPDFFLSVRVLSRLFRRLFLDKLAVAHKAGQLEFFGKHAKLAHPKAFAAYLVITITIISKVHSWSQLSRGST